MVLKQKLSSPTETREFPWYHSDFTRPPPGGRVTLFGNYIPASLITKSDSVSLTCQWLSVWSFGMIFNLLCWRGSHRFRHARWQLRQIYLFPSTLLMSQIMPQTLGAVNIFVQLIRFCRH